MLTAVNCVGTSLQEIKVDCDIDDRASIAITKKGKVWEVSQWNVTLLGKSCAIIWTHFLKCRTNYLIVSYCFNCWRIYAATINLYKLMFFLLQIFLATSHGKLRSYSTSAASHGQPVLKEEHPVRERELALIPDLYLLVSLSRSGPSCSKAGQRYQPDKSLSSG